MAKIMLVEDDNNLREIYEARLQAEGYTIVAAQDGEEALVIANNERPDLVISDVMMPKISGFEMLDILRNTEGLKDVKVIMLTALGQNDDQQRADRLGADRYLVKSQVTLEDIVRVAQELLTGEAAPVEEPAVAAVDAPDTTPAETTVVSTPEPEIATTSDVNLTEAETVVAVAEPVEVEPIEAPVAIASEQAEPIAPLDSSLELAVPAVEANESTASASTEAQDDAEPMVVESAAVASQIEDFAAGSAPSSLKVDPIPVATSEADADDSSSEPESADTTDTTENESPTDAAEDSLTALLNNNSIEAPTDETKEAAVPTVTVAAPVNAPTIINGKKIISPLDSEPQPDIHQLLAIEEAKNLMNEPVATTEVEVADSAAATVAPLITPTATTAPPASVTPTAPSASPSVTPPAGLDPNSIAL